MTAGADTAIGALIECAGAANVGPEMGVSGIAPPGAERAFVADPDVILVTSWPAVADERCGGTPCSRACRAVARGPRGRDAERAAGRPLPVHRRRLLGPGLPTASRSRARGRAVTEARRRRRALLALAAALPIAMAAAVALGSVPPSHRLRRWRRCCRRPACRLGPSARRAGRGHPLVGAPAARPPRRARRRRAGRRRIHAAVRLPQPHGRLGPARRGRRRRARRGAGRPAGLGGPRLPGPSRWPRSRARWPPSSPSTRSPMPAGAPRSTACLLTGIAVSALASAGTSLLLVATEEFRVKTVLFWLAGGLEGRELDARPARAPCSSSPASRCSPCCRARSTCSRWAQDEAASLGLRRPRDAARALRAGRAGGGRRHGRRGLGAVRRPHGAARAAAAASGRSPATCSRRRSWGAPSWSSWPTSGARDAARSHRPAARVPHRVRGRALLPGRAARAARARTDAPCSRRASLVVRRGRARRPARRRRSRWPPGEALALVGPNAAGKSTLLRALAGLLPRGGEVSCSCDARPLHAWARDALARAMALVTSEDEGARHAAPWRTAWRWDAIPIAGRSARSPEDDRAAVAARARVDRASRRWPGGGSARSPPASGSWPTLARGPGPGAASPPARRARRPPRHRPPAPALPRARRGAGRAAWPCWRSSTTCSARPRGRSGWCSLDGGRVAAEGAPAAVLASEACARAFGVAIHGHAVPGLPHPLYSFEEAAMKIVSLLPAATEIVCALGLRELPRGPLARVRLPGGRERRCPP